MCCFSAGQLAPVEAFGALVQGYARLRQVDAAVDAVRRYHAAGGVPDVRMLRALADVCVKMGEYKVAMQVGLAGIGVATAVRVLASFALFSLGRHGVLAGQ